MMEKNNFTKKDLKVVIFVSLMALFSVGLATMRYETKMINKNKLNRIEETAKTEKLEKENVQTVEDLLVEKIIKYNKYFGKYYTDFLNIPNQAKLKFLYSSIENKDSSFTTEQLNEVVNNYFDNSFMYTNESIACGDSILYDYDGVSTYNFSGNACVNDDLSFSSQTYIVANNYDEALNEYVVEAKNFYYYCGDNCYMGMLYSEPNYETMIYSIDNALISIMTQNEVLDMAYEKVGDILPTTIYHFVKSENGNFLLKNVEIMKKD